MRLTMYALGGLGAAFALTGIIQLSSLQKEEVQGNPGTDVAGAGCQLPEAPQRVLLLPGNHSTSVEPGSLEVQVQRGREPVTEESLRVLAQTVSLTMWPEGTEVAISTQVELSSHGGTVKVAPAAELSDGWYQLTATPSSGMEWADPDVTVTQFRVGSEPVIQEVTVCDGAPGKAKVVVSLSEAVDESEDLEFELRGASGRGLACQRSQRFSGSNAPPEILPPDGVVKIAPQEGDRIAMECPASVVGGDLSLVRTRGQLSSRGRRARLDNLPIPAAQLRDSEPGCKHLTFETPNSILSN